MEAIGPWIAGIYFAGFIASLFVYRVRAGVGVFEYGLGMLFDYGLAWALLSGIKTMFWPIVLIYWLVNGQPEPRYVFNHKAAQREAEQQWRQQNAQGDTEQQFHGS